MVDAIRETLGAYYLYIKFVHLLAVMMWSWSTAVAYVWYIKDAWKTWADNPQDSILKARRDCIAVPQFEGQMASLI